MPPLQRGTSLNTADVVGKTIIMSIQLFCTKLVTLDFIRPPHVLCLFVA